MEEARLWIRDIGFPAAVALFVLFRVDVTLNRMGDKFENAMTIVANAMNVIITNQQRIMDEERDIQRDVHECCKLGPPMSGPVAEHPVNPPAPNPH